MEVTDKDQNKQEIIISDLMSTESLLSDINEKIISRVSNSYNLNFIFSRSFYLNYKQC